jgi:hypothetical protein
MADGKKFDIELGTKADTSGLEAVERQLKAVAAAGKEAVNPMTDGSQLRAGRAEDAAEQVRETTEAIQEQAEALEELTDAEAGVVDATKRLNEEAKKPDGFKALFDQQRLQQTAREMRALGATVRDLFQEFAATEAGKEFFGGLSDEARTFGSVAAQTGAAVAQGWAAGGPIGAAVAGLNVLVREVGDSFLAVSRAQEEAARSYAAEEARIIAQTRERRAIAENRAIEQQIQRENDTLQDQSEILREQQGLLKSRRELANATFQLEQAQSAAAGVSPEQLEIERVKKELRDKEQEIAQARVDRQNERGLLEVERDAREVRIRNARNRNDPEAVAELEREKAELQEQLQDRERADSTLARGEDAQLEAAILRAATRLTEIATGTTGAAARDTERRARDEAAAQERVRREAEAEAVRRQGLGREGEGIADGVARGAADPRQALAIEQIGNRIAADPAGDGLGELATAIERLMTTADEARARQLRQALERIERLEARVTKRADNGS